MKDRIKAVRASTNMNQADFGKAIGVTLSAVQKWELGLATPRPSVIKNIVSQFGINEEWLREGSGEMFADKSRAVELTELVQSLMADRPESFRNALVTTLLRFNPNGPEWEVLERIYKSVSDLAPGTPMDVRTEESSA